MLPSFARMRLAVSRWRADHRGLQSAAERFSVLAFMIAASATTAVLPPPLAASADVLRVQALIAPSGSGRLLVNNGSAPWSWEACNRSGCKPFAGGREIQTRGASAGTVFRVESHGDAGLSPEWRGRLTQIEPPGVDGVIRANDFVSPIPARWRGGWEGEFSETQLSACVTASGEDCTTLTDPSFPRSCAKDASFALDARFVGRFLRVANRRVGGGPLFRTAIAVTSPYGGEVWAGSRNTAVRIAGRIAAPTSAYIGECGPPPPGRAVIDQRGRAWVDCLSACRASLAASQNGVRLRVTRTLPSRSALLVTPPVMLRVPSRIIKARLGPGRVRLALEIDGKQVAQRSMDYLRSGDAAS